MPISLTCRICRTLQKRFCRMWTPGSATDMSCSPWEDPTRAPSGGLHTHTTPPAEGDRRSSSLARAPSGVLYTHGPSCRRGEKEAFLTRLPPSRETFLVWWWWSLIECLPGPASQCHVSLSLGEQMKSLVKEGNGGVWAVSAKRESE